MQGNLPEQPLSGLSQRAAKDSLCKDAQRELEPTAAPHCLHAIAAERYHGHSSKRRPQRKRATSGQLTDAERASAWRVFLGASTDINYKKLKDDALPDAASISSDSDPLGLVG